MVIAEELHLHRLNLIYRQRETFLAKRNIHGRMKAQTGDASSRSLSSGT